MGWRDFSAEIEANFNPRAAVKDFERFFAVYEARSAETFRHLDVEREIRYGDGPLQTLDFFPAGAGRGPVALYIHGGYWRGLDKGLVAFVAEPFVQRGHPVVSINYDLCPKVSLDRVVAETIEAIAFIARDPGRFRHDGRVYVTGDSAGGHLAAMALSADWSRHGLTRSPICGAAPVTGIFDVEPVLSISVNQEIGLTAEMVPRNSPLRLKPRPPVPVLLAVGGAETGGWIDQTMGYADVCRDAGCAVETFVAPGENHFSITLARADAGHPLTRRMIAHLEAAAGR